MNILDILREQAREIAENNIVGWGNTMIMAADEIERLRAENGRLREALTKIVEPFSDLSFVDGWKLLSFIYDTAQCALAAGGE